MIIVGVSEAGDVSSGAAAVGVAGSVTFTTITYVVVAVIGEVVCAAVVTDMDRDLPGSWPGFWGWGSCM